LRDNHEGTPEIVSTCERDGMYFGVVRVQTPTEDAAFDFGVDRGSHLALQRILECRPFGSMPGIKYRFYFIGNYSRRKLHEEPVTIGIRVEADKNGKKVLFDSPASLASNLMWFLQMKDLREGDNLRRIPA